MITDRDISMKIPDIAPDLMSERDLWSETKKNMQKIKSVLQLLL